MGRLKVAESSLSERKTRIAPPPVVTFDVISNLLLRYPAVRRAKISLDPEVPTLAGAREKVHVVLADVPFLDPNIQAEAGLPDQLPRPTGHLALQHRISTLGPPNQGIFDFVERMRSATVPAQPYVGAVRSPRKTSPPKRYVRRRLVWQRHSD